MSERKIKKIANVVTVIVAMVCVSVLYLKFMDIDERINSTYSKYNVLSNEINQVRNDESDAEEKISEIEDQIEYLTFGLEPTDAIRQVAQNRSFRVYEKGNGYIIVQTVGQHRIVLKGEFVEFIVNGSTDQDGLEYKDENGSHWLSINPYFEKGIDMNGYNKDAIDY